MNQLSPQNMKVLIDHVNAETAFDLEGTLATLTDDCVFEDMPSAEVFRGHIGVTNYYREWWNAFGNTPSGSKRYVPDENCLIVETRFVGVHKGHYRGIEATGRPINLPVAIVVTFKDGLMCGERFYYDRATLFSQIGA
jgi:ketosteroid isomerase-like protein